MTRTDFVERLELVSAGLADKGTAPVFQQFIFRPDGWVESFNGFTGVQFDFGKTGLVGGVQGKLLVELLRNSKARDVEVIKCDETLELKVGTSKIKMPCDAEVEFPQPASYAEDENLMTLKLTQDVLSALRCCLIAAVDDSALGEFMGLVFNRDSEGVAVYSTDRKVLTRHLVPDSAVIPDEKKGADSTLTVGMSAAFAALILTTAKSLNGGEGELIISKRLITATFGVGCKVYGSPLDVSDVSRDRLLQVFNQYASSEGVQYREVPAGLGLCLKRAIPVLAEALPLDSGVGTKVSGGDGRLEMTTNVAHTEVVDSIVYDGDSNGVMFYVDPRRIKNFLGEIGVWHVSNNAMLLASTDKAFVVVVSISSEESRSRLTKKATSPMPGAQPAEPEDGQEEVDESSDLVAS